LWPKIFRLQKYSEKREMFRLDIGYSIQENF